MLVPITEEDYGVELALAYAGPDNVVGRALYRRAACYLHADAAAALGRAAEQARTIGWRLRIYDGFRPESAQWQLWNLWPDARYVAPPGPDQAGSVHSRGVAVDLTLLDTQGQPLDMGTGFDDFTPLSHHGRADLPAQAQANRLLLLGLMRTAGFEPLMTEWWHYQLPDAQRYPRLDDGATPDGPLAA